MQKTRKRILSVLLSMVMATTMLVGLPATKALAAPGISSGVVYYDLNAPRNVSVEVTWDTADDINTVWLDHGAVGMFLSRGTDYTIVGDVLTINSSFLSALGLAEGGTFTFEVVFNDGDLASPAAANTLVPFELNVVRSPFVCENVRTGVQYTLLEDAVDAAVTGDTILLIANVDEDYARPINDKNLTIDMDGKNINLNTGYIEVKNGYNLEIKNGGTMYAWFVWADGTDSTLSIKAEELRLYFGIQASNGGKAEVEADVFSGEFGVIAETGATVTVTGNIIAYDGNGVHAEDATVTVIGNITAYEEDGDNVGFGVWAEGSAIVTVTGNITADRDGVWAQDDATVIVEGNINAGQSGIVAFDNAVVELEGTINASWNGVYAIGNVTVTVIGDIIAENEDGVHAAVSATVTVTGSIEANWSGVYAYGNTTITVTGSIEANWDGVYAYGNTTVTIVGDINAGWSGIYAEEGAKVTVTGSITAEGGVLAGSGTIVEVNGDIEADRGIYVSGIEISVTVVGDIKADYVGVLVAWWDGPSRNVEVTVTGSITAAKDNPGTYWLGTGVLAFGCVGLTITVNGNMDVEYCGVIVEECEEALVIVNGNIKAGYIGVFALDDVQVFANGDIQVTSEELPFEDVLLVGVASGFGAEVTVEGTITAKNYIALYFDKYWADNPYGEGSGWVYTFVYVEANGNIATSSKTGYLEYNDSDGDLQSISYVWVKAATTPGTGDSTAPWLLIAALMVAALGTASVLAYRKREEKE